MAFAARCARRVTHLIDEYWPGIPENYRHPIMNAIELAESSADRKEPDAGLHDAVIGATVSAGAAVMADHPDRSGNHPTPKNAHDGTIVAFVARAAERAARAARNSSTESADISMEAWSFARKAAGSADDRKLVDTLDEVLANVSPTPIGGDPFGGDEDPAAVRRGKTLFLLFALAIAAMHAVEIVGMIAAARFPINSILGAVCGGYLVYSIWKQEEWTWNYGPIIVAGLALFGLGSMAFVIVRGLMRPESRGSTASSRHCWRGNGRRLRLTFST